MRFLTLLLALALPFQAAQAQSILENLPSQGDESEPEVEAPPKPAATPADYTVTDVNADVTADTASHARDQALLQAERSALSQLYARFNQTDVSAKLSDDAVAALVQSFEVQSEHLSAVRYIGVFTIHFKPSLMQKKFGKAAPDPSAVAEEAKPAPVGPLSHMVVAVQVDSLASWTQIKKRMSAPAAVARVDVIDLARGTSHVDLSYSGSAVDLQQALTAQGLVLRQQNGVWTLYDGSMTPR